MQLSSIDLYNMYSLDALSNTQAGHMEGSAYSSQSTGPPELKTLQLIRNLLLRLSSAENYCSLWFNTNGC